MNEYAKHLSNMAKVLEENGSGSKAFRYRAMGPDHYYHATNLLYLAGQKGGISSDDFEQREVKAEIDFDVFNYDKEDRASHFDPFDY